MTDKDPNTDFPIGNVDSAPTMPLSGVQKIRLGELARQLELAMRQGYIEANLLAQLLDLVKMFVPFLGGFLPKAGA